MKDRFGKTGWVLLAFGLVLFGLTLVLNERMVREVFPAYQASFSVELKLGVVVLDALFVLIGIFILVYRKPKAGVLLDTLIGIGFTVVLLIGVEFTFYYLNSKNEAQLGPVTFDFLNHGQGGDVQFVGEHAQAFFQRDAWLGYRLVPNSRVVASRKKGEEILYKVVYSIDAEGRRDTPTVHLQTDPQFMLFFGGSYTFGEGVNDDETMPAQISQLAPKYRAYNYGVGGYGPQHMLAKLQSEEMTVEIEERQGILVYVFINEHIDRAIGSMRIHSLRGEVMPYYFLDADGELVRRGNCVSGRPVTAALYSILGKSQTLKYFNIDVPVRTRPRDVETTVAILKEARDVYGEKFNSEAFYVLIYPSLGTPELIPYLEAAGISYLDYANLPDVYDDDFWLGEGHPTAKAHNVMAQHLVEDLNLVDDRIMVESE